MSKFCQKKVMSSLVIRKIMVPGEDGSRTEESSKTSYGGKCGKKGKKKSSWTVLIHFLKFVNKKH